MAIYHKYNTLCYANVVPLVRKVDNNQFNLAHYHGESNNTIICVSSVDAAMPLGLFPGLLADG
jgi:hypothetical protein